MNERIRELAEQAGVLTDFGEDIKVGRWGIGGNYKQMQTFAELIVRECITVLDENDGALHHTELLKKHFGVE
jgi:hypothetical protein